MAEQPETATSSAAPPPEPQVGGFYLPSGGGFQMMPIMYPTVMHAANRGGAGVYAVPAAGPTIGNQLIPLTYTIPSRPPAEAGAAADNGHGVQQPQQQHPAGGQRQVVVRRFQIVFQLDLLLMLKLAAVIFLFNQDGSKQRLMVLVLAASIVYLYQTGALAPLIRWLSQSMQRAAAPPRPPRPARAENAPLVPRQNDNGAVAGEGIPDGQGDAGGENRPADNGNQAGENENLADHAAENGGNQWWGIVKEIQMIVFGFITSLLPGFHNID